MPKQSSTTEPEQVDSGYEELAEGIVKSWYPDGTPWWGIKITLAQDTAIFALPCWHRGIAQVRYLDDGSPCIVLGGGYNNHTN